MWDTIVYFSSLMLCVCLGSMYRKIQSNETKRNYGTGVGLLVACLVCGPQILHTIFLVLGNTIIIRCCHKSYVHRLSFMYTWLLLLYFQTNVKKSIYQLWIFQAITLRMVGLAFEVNLGYKAKLAQEAAKKAQNEMSEIKMSPELSLQTSNVLETPLPATVSGQKDTKDNTQAKSENEDGVKKLPSDVKKVTSMTDLPSTPSAVRRSIAQASKSVPPSPPVQSKKLSIGSETRTLNPPLTLRDESAIDKERVSVVANTNVNHNIQGESVAELQKNNNNSKAISKIRMATTMLESDAIQRDPTAVEIISYAYFFIGLHKGPYYRWKTFDDHFYNSFGVLGDCHVITEHKLKKALICGVAYMLLRMKYNPQIYFQPYFYEIYDTDFRYLYSVPQLLMYFLSHQIVMLLCTSVCTETGFGVYPAKTQPVPGHGPTMNLGLLKLASTTAEVAMEQEYNFSMLKCFENEKLFLGPRMADTMRAWDMPTRYWFRAYAYKNFMKSNKEVRSAFTFLCWTVWLSPSIQQFIVSITLWVYMHLEEEFQDLYDTTGSLKLSWSMGFSIMRMMCLVYLTPCLVIEDTAAVLRYYHSINWIYHVVLLSLIVYAIVVYKFRASNVV